MDGSASPFVFTVVDLLREQGRSRDVHIATHADIGVELSRTLADRPLTADLLLSSVAGGILVRGDVHVTVRHTCSRCLTQRDEESTVTLTQLFGLQPGDDVDYAVSADTIDLEQVIRDEVALSFPLRPRCPEACEGLGSSVESDLNTSSSGAAGESDSPFAVLRDLLKPGE